MLKRILMAGTLGAWIGALVALELSPAFWWLGTLVGFMVGYLSYGPVAVLRATRTALLAVVAWRPKPHWRIRYRFYAYYLFAMSGPILWFVFLLALAALTQVKRNDGEPLTTEKIKGMWLVIGVCFSVSSLILTLIGLGIGRPVTDDQYSKDLLRSTRTYATYCNLVILPFTTSYFVIKNGFKVTVWIIETSVVGVKKLPGAIVVLGRAIQSFFIMFVRLIHNHARLVAGMSAATGAGIGYLAGSAMVGGLAGFLTGLAACQLIAFLLKRLPAPVCVS